MPSKQINSYFAAWRASDHRGVLTFYYFDGSEGTTRDLEAGDFAVLIDLLRNEKPVFGDHATATVHTKIEPTGGSEPVGG